MLLLTSLVTTLLSVLVLLNVSSAFIDENTVCFRMAQFFLDDASINITVLVNGLETSKPVGGNRNLQYMYYFNLSFLQFPVNPFALE